MNRLWLSQQSASNAHRVDPIASDAFSLRCHSSLLLAPRRTCGPTSAVLRTCRAPIHTALCDILTTERKSAELGRRWPSLGRATGIPRADPTASDAFFCSAAIIVARSTARNAAALAVPRAYFVPICNASDATINRSALPRYRCQKGCTPSRLKGIYDFLI